MKYRTFALFLAGVLIFGMSAPWTSAAQAERVDVLIGFQNTPGASEQALVRAFGGEISHSYSIVPAIAATVPSQSLNGLRNHPRITVVEIDGQVHAIGHAAELSNTWGVSRIGAGDVHHSNVGSGVKVAIIDTGIDYTHSDLSGNYAGGSDFVNDDTDPMDDHGHGTHVAGTVAALMNGAGVVGTAPGASLYGLKAISSSGGGAWSDIISALEWAAENGMDVTNNSYGSASNPGVIVEAAFNNSAAAGVLHIASAGNLGDCSGANENVGWPAQYASVIAVSATDQSDSRPCFSSTGPSVEIAAPGVGINSTVLGGGYQTKDGTSMASPHVAGVAALVLAAGAEAGAVRGILTTTAEDLGPNGKDNHYGWGLVDAAAAVAAVTNPEPDPDPTPDPETPLAMKIDSISYATSGGKTNDRHLSVTITVVDGSGTPVSGAALNVAVANERKTWNFSGTTNSSGAYSAQITNAPRGCYSTTVSSVTLSGAEWDGIVPENGGCK